MMGNAFAGWPGKDNITPGRWRNFRCSMDHEQPPSRRKLKISTGRAKGKATQSMSTATITSNTPTLEEVAGQRCPICRRPVEPALFARHVALEGIVVQALSVFHPTWRQAEGACPNCVQDALANLAATGQDLEDLLIHEEARTRNHMVAASGQPALPVPLRIHANPLFRGRGVVLGFLDSGFYPHPDLVEPVNRIRMTVDAMQHPPVEGADFSPPEVRSWHGLMTSSVAAGNGFLSGGRYRGIASEAELVLARVGQRNMRIPDSDIAHGLRWFLENFARFGVRVLNISMGGDAELETAHSPVDRLAEALTAAGVLVVVAAGNSGQRHIVPPASAPTVLTVGGATDQNRLHTQLRAFQPWRSSFGPTRSGHQKPEIVAPAMLLAAPILPGTSQAREAARLTRLLRLDDAALMAERDEPRRVLYLHRGALDGLSAAQVRFLLAERMSRHNWLSSYYQFVDGTSVAAPVVASIAVQMIEANPGLTPSVIKRLLIDTAVPMPAVPFEKQGYGVVNPSLAVAAALRAPGGPLVGYPISPYRLPAGMIIFYYYNPRVEQVALVSSFNGWLAAGSEFTRLAPGIFRLALPPLPPGRYRYKFLLDYTTAVDDPENPDKESDGYGGFNSVLRVV